jgi:hypothetical protein
MGTWGPGNFDSDDTREYLDVAIKRLVDEIETGFSFKDNPEAFLAYHGEYRVMPAIDMYITLAETYLSYRVDEEMAACWRRDYLKAFDADKSVNPADFKSERRQVIVETFDRLDALIAST